MQPTKNVFKIRSRFSAEPPLK